MTQQIVEWGIYEAESKYGTTEFLVVKDFGAYVESLMLVDVEPDKNAEPLGDMWTDCGRLSYTFVNKLVELERILSPEEKERIKVAILRAFGIGIAEECEVRTPEAYAKQITRLEAQRDVYKELYLREVSR